MKKLLFEENQTYKRAERIKETCKKMKNFCISAIEFVLDILLDI